MRASKPSLACLTAAAVVAVSCGLLTACSQASNPVASSNPGAAPSQSAQGSTVTDPADLAPNSSGFSDLLDFALPQLSDAQVLSVLGIEYFGGSVPAAQVQVVRSDDFGIVGGAQLPTLNFPSSPLEQCTGTVLPVYQVNENTFVGLDTAGFQCPTNWQMLEESDVDSLVWGADAPEMSSGLYQNAVGVMRNGQWQAFDNPTQDLTDTEFYMISDVVSDGNYVWWIETTGQLHALNSWRLHRGSIASMHEEIIVTSAEVPGTFGWPNTNPQLLLHDDRIWFKALAFAHESDVKTFKTFSAGLSQLPRYTGQEMTVAILSANGDGSAAHKELLGSSVFGFASDGMVTGNMSEDPNLVGYDFTPEIAAPPFLITTTITGATQGTIAALESGTSGAYMSIEQLIADGPWIAFTQSSTLTALNLDTHEVVVLALDPYDYPAKVELNNGVLAWQTMNFGGYVYSFDLNTKTGTRYATGVPIGGLFNLGEKLAIARGSLHGTADYATLSAN